MVEYIATSGARVQDLFSQIPQTTAAGGGGLGLGGISGLEIVRPHDYCRPTF
jgi:hypothetical protein